MDAPTAVLQLPLPGYPADKVARDLVRQIEAMLLRLDVPFINRVEVFHALAEEAREFAFAMRDSPKRRKTQRNGVMKQLSD